MGSGASDLEHLGGGGEVHPLRGLEGLDGAPHPPTVRALDRGGGWDVLPGQGLERPAQGLLVVLDRQEVVTTTPADPLGGVRLGVHGVSGHHDPAWVEGFKQDPESRDLVGLAGHPLLGSTAPVAWSKAARRCGAGSSPVRAPRMVLPSTAITVRPLMVPVRVHNHALSSASRSAGSRSCRTRRIVDSDGRSCPSSSPRERRSAPVRSVVCSHIAVRLRQPASTPVMDRDRTVGRSWRTPRRSLGSATFLRTWTRGWRDKAVVVEDALAA